MTRGFTVSLEWIATAGVLGVLLALVQAGPESARAQMMSPSPSPSYMETQTPAPMTTVPPEPSPTTPMETPSPMTTPTSSPMSTPQEETPTPTATPMTTPASSPELSSSPDPEEKGICYVRDTIACESGTTRKVCEERLEGIFHAGGRCPKESYRECNGGMVINGIHAIQIENCDTQTDLDIFNQFHLSFAKDMEDECRLMSDHRYECVYTGTYVGPGITGMSVSKDGKTCYVQGEAWYRCVRRE